MTIRPENSIEVVLNNIEQYNTKADIRNFLLNHRWFFIEQDITYWSGQGRLMFYNAIQNV